MKISVTSLVDNIPNKNLRNEGGLSFFISVDNYDILFDTGVNDAFLRNARILKKKVESIDAAVISHGHYDHAGGLKYFLDVNSNARIFIHKEAVNKFYLNLLFFKKYIGIDEKVIQCLLSDNRVEFVNDSIKINDYFEIMDNFPNKYEKPKGNDALLRKDKVKYFMDSFSHEIALLIRSNYGLIIISGCSHNGFLNIIEKAHEMYPDEEIKAFIGGMHLLKVPIFDKFELSEDIAFNMMEIINKYKIEKIYACHCSGKKNIEYLSSLSNNKIEYFKMGEELIF